MIHPNFTGKQICCTEEIFFMPQFGEKKLQLSFQFTVRMLAHIIVRWRSRFNKDQASKCQKLSYVIILDNKKELMSFTGVLVQLEKHNEVLFNPFLVLAWTSPQTRKTKTVKTRLFVKNSSHPYPGIVGSKCPVASPFSPIPVVGVECMHFLPPDDSYLSSTPLPSAFTTSPTPHITVRYLLIEIHVFYT